MLTEEHQGGARLGSHAAIYEYLAAHQVFGVLPPAALRDLVPEVIERTYRKGQHLFYAGDPQTYVFIVRLGLVALTDLDDRGNARVVLTYDSGDVFGPPAIVLGQRHAFTATALIDTHTLLIGKDTFDQLYRRFPELTHQILRELQSMLRRSQETTLRLARTPVVSRVAAFLLRFAEKCGPVGDGDTDFDLPLSREDLAFLLGTSRETIIRALTRLTRAGVIASRGKRVCIRDPDALRRLAER
ncbi:MAG: Crp/Fnr family transcriptional regulator [Chloroflexi bacterium]|nr:Crp/Fnr family transcriptional regulator [Chloroflexota bacterium]